MKKLLLLTALFICSFAIAQKTDVINRMQGSSLAEAKNLVSDLVSLNTDKYELVKEKPTKEAHLLFYLPAGLTAEQKEEAAVNAYESGIVVRLSKLENGTYKVREFYAEPKLMFSIINDVFYPAANYNDFVGATKYRNYIDSDKKYKFYFYSGDSPKSKYKFYSY
ncbi:hypothetical protein QWY99_01180 [Flavobacterium branchiarum]|uniref:DUF4252 domain-containing protein n=1 Tax=Flavobacterium branchiarum TaxID=1114870 RepID=A0ABV5FQW5_9FLAO|nr:hypothetical protein [Flavobacterium branchiarum]MDN3671678.1 hypothetical protein [Flavobacterium branchiarum]